MIGKPTSIAKITRPRISGVIERKRLFRLLDTGRKKPIIWVSAQAGSGKTTLISSYLDARKLPYIWYQLDDGDSDIATFFYYMGLAVQKAIPRKKKRMPLLTPEYLQGVTTFARRYFEELFGRIADFRLRIADNAPSYPPVGATRCGRPNDSGRGNASPLQGEGGFVIVLDNYQDVSPDSQFHEVISNGLSMMPENISAMIISRAEPHRAFARIRASSNFSTIGWEDLRLTVEEVKEIARSYSKERLKGKEIEYVYGQTQGWAAGLVLMLEGDKEGISRHIPAYHTHKEVFDYFAEEIFRRIDKEKQDFLLITSLLPSMMPVHSAEGITGRKDAGDILSSMSRNHFFTERRSGKEPVYQYHPLFKEFLQSLAKGTFSNDELSNIQLHAAGLLEESGYTEDAAELYIRSENVEGLIKVIMKNAQSLITQGRGMVLEEWLNHIPRKIFEDSPWLLYYTGVCRQPFNPSDARKYFKKALESFTLINEMSGILMSWSGIIDTYIYEWNDFKPIDYWIDWLKKHIKGEPSFPYSEIEACVSSSMIGGMMIRQPHNPDIHIWIERAMLSLHKSDDINLRLRAYMYIANYYTWVGDRTRSLHEMEKIQKMADSPDASPLTLVTYMFLNAGINIWLMAETDISIKTVSDALDTAEKTGVHIWDDMLFAIGICSALVKGDYDMAGDFLSRMESNLIPARSHGFCQYYYLSAWYNLLLNRKEIALTHASKALDTALKTGYVFPIALCRHEMSQVLFSNGEYEKAIAQLEHAKKIALDTKSLVLQFMFALAEAQFAINRGIQKKGLDYLVRALRLGAGQRYINLMWWWQPKVMTQLCVKALDAGIEVEYVKAIIRRCNIAPPDTIAECGFRSADNAPSAPPLKLRGGRGSYEYSVSRISNLDNCPYPIKIYTLGRFEILNDDKPVVFSGKVQKKPLEMLKALVSFGGEDVSEEQIIDNLWPDAEGDSAHKSFEITLNRLRKLIGNEKYIILSGGRLTLNNRYCWSDIKAFEGVIKEAEKRWDKNSPTHPSPIEGEGGGKAVEALRLTEKAMDLYRGKFMPADTDKTWATGTRERLENKLIRIITAAGNYYENRGHYGRAIDFFRKGIEIDELAEELYQRLMLCYQRLGQEAEAIKIYNICRHVLSTDLGIMPSSRTEEIYNKIRNPKINR